MKPMKPTIIPFAVYNWQRRGLCRGRGFSVNPQADTTGKRSNPLLLQGLAIRFLRKTKGTARNLSRDQTWLDVWNAVRIGILTDQPQPCSASCILELFAALLGGKQLNKTKLSLTYAMRTV